MLQFKALIELLDMQEGLNRATRHAGSARGGAEDCEGTELTEYSDSCSSSLDYAPAGN